MAIFEVEDKIYYNSFGGRAPEEYEIVGNPGMIIKVIEDSTSLVYLISLMKSPIEISEFVYAREEELTERP